MFPPAGQPPAPGSKIALPAHNALVNDLVAEITDSLSRSGKGSMQAVLKAIDGALSGPGYAFANEPNSGLYRAAAGDIRLAVLGAVVAKLVASGIEITGTVMATGGLADDTTHGNRGGGSLHATATGAVAGFLSSADKTKLDDATASPTASKLVLRDASGRAQFADPSADQDAATKAYADSLAITSSTGTMTAGAGWDVSPSGEAGYLRKTGPLVSLKLHANSTGGGTGSLSSIATLPTGFRPISALRFLHGYFINGADGTEPIDSLFQIDTSGVIGIFSIGGYVLNSKVYHGITFPSMSNVHTARLIATFPNT
jgi:hypothetical protein